MSLNKLNISDKIIIPKAHLIKMCKKGQGKCTCRYLSLSKEGFFCSKNTELKKTIDEAVVSGKFKAKGDNCDGFKPV